MRGRDVGEMWGRCGEIWGDTSSAEAREMSKKETGRARELTYAACGRFREGSEKVPRRAHVRRLCRSGVAEVCVSQSVLHTA